MALRLLMVGLLGGFAALDRNPLVILEARLGLSPSPLERLFGIRGYFSGMTEATYRLTHLDFSGAAQANILVFPTLAAFVVALLMWRVPDLKTRARELQFIAILVLGTVINNVAPALLA